MGRTKRDYLFLALKGMAIGAAEFIPGFSGATVALISGIYKELIDSINNLRFSCISVLFKQGFKEFWKKINGTFMVVITTAIVISLFTFYFFVSYLIKEFPVSTNAFLLGVIIVSIIYIFKDFKQWNLKLSISILIGIGINVGLTYLTPVPMSKDSEYWIILLCAVAAALIMYLPGVSVTLFFILIGQYEFILKSISNFETDFILIYFGGLIISFIAFSRLFSKLLNKYQNISTSFLAGLMIGSLYKLWPWKHTLLSHTNQFAKIIPIKQENVLPGSYFELTGKDPITLYAILMLITGFLVVYLLHNTFSNKQEQ